MVKESTLAPMDIVLYHTDTIGSLLERLCEYGLLGVLKPKLATKIGIVIEVCDKKFILCFGKHIELKTFNMMKNKITSVKRFLGFNDTRNLYTTHEKLILSLVADMDKEMSILNHAKKLNKGNLSSSLICILTASYVRYPKEYSEFKIKLSDILTEKHGFIEIDYKGF